MEVFAQRSGRNKYTLLHESAEACTFHCPGLALHMASIMEAGGHVVLQVHISRDASLLRLVPIVWLLVVRQTPRRGLTESQCKTWVSNILNSETEVKSNQQDNFLHKLVRGMPVRLRKCKATCTDNAASSCSLALPINRASHCTAIENCIACRMHAQLPSEKQFPSVTTFVQNFFPACSLGICAQRCTQANPALLYHCCCMGGLRIERIAETAPFLAGCGIVAGCWQRPHKRRTSNVLPSTITSAP